MSDLEVTRAERHERPALENLLQLYIHDFSEHWVGRPEGELGEDGRFLAPPLDAYWEDGACIPLLVRLEGRLAGFALLDGASHTGQPVERNMAEFFIVRKHRRGGVGTRAAQAIFSRYPGQWETAVARRNLAALAFWRGVVAQHPLSEEVQELDVSTGVWNGPILRFHIRAPA